MADATVIISVDAETAQAYAAMSTEAQKKVQILLSLRMQELVSEPAISLKNLMDDIGAKAETRGLTPEILEYLLHDE
jgi:hypothetical protein